MRAQPTILGDPRRPTDITRWNERLARVLNGNVSFGSTMDNADQDKNMSCWKASGTTPGAGVEFSITHSLGRVPLTIVGQDTSNGAVLYRGATPWTATTVYLKSTIGAANYRVILA